jgi:MoxR-like ATPase
MAWQAIYQGEGVSRGIELPPAPPWRQFPAPTRGSDGHGIFQPPDGLLDAVNAAIFLRRPLLLTGAPGSGKSSVIHSVAAELDLGRVLRWHITSRSTLVDALYRYDVLGRIHAQRLAREAGSAVRDDIAPFLQFGPLGNALVPAPRPRALLVDEIDKSDLDLPGDLLDVLERGEFRIPELERQSGEAIPVREWDDHQTHVVTDGVVQCTEYPFVVLTSNGERDFPAPFLRRCIRFTMPPPTVESLTRIVEAHLGSGLADNVETAALVERFVARVAAGESIAVDQLLNAVFLLGDGGVADEATRGRLEVLVLRELSRA